MNTIRSCDEPDYPVVSSNTLFHFVTERSYLEDVLTHNFRARYCFEDLNCLTPDSIPSIGPIRDFAIPMKCFCDIPLSLTARHLRTYGPYGIGLTKEWGMRNGLNPILYLHPQSWLRKGIEEAIEIARNLGFAVKADKLNDYAKVPIDSDGLFEHFDYLLYFTKPYQGPFTRDGVTSEVRFYDEREWRFVPKNGNGEWEQSILGYTWTAMLQEEREEHNKRVFNDSSATLEFTPNDVRYIIVQSENELIEFTKLIDELKFKYGEADRAVLKTRLISAEHIRMDF